MTDRDYRRLMGCDARLIRAVDRVLQKMAAEGFPMTVTSGARTVSEQQALYAQGRTAPGRIVTYCDGIKKPSNHQSGRAADLAFIVNGKPDWGDYHPWETFGEAAEAEGLRWGGRWPKERRDRPHVELPRDEGEVKA